MRDSKAGILLVLPLAIGVLVFVAYPLIMAVDTSLRDYFMLSQSKPYIGFENYRYLFQDDLFKKSFMVTWTFAAMLVPMQTSLGLCLAILLNGPLLGLRAFRLAFFLPVVTSLVVGSTLWIIMFDSTQGIINGILQFLGLPRQPFLSSPAQALPSIALMSTWKGVGFSMLVFLGGLLAIPSSLYEAAKVDGAGRLASFWYITLPQLRRVTLFNIVYVTIESTKVFTSVYLMTQGGPMDTTRVLSYHIYTTAFRQLDMGYASSMAMILLASITLVLLVQFGLSRGDD